MFFRLRGHKGPQRPKLQPRAHPKKGSDEGEEEEGEEAGTSFEDDGTTEESPEELFTELDNLSQRSTTTRDKTQKNRGSPESSMFLSCFLSYAHFLLPRKHDICSRIQHYKAL